ATVPTRPTTAGPRELVTVGFPRKVVVLPVWRVGEGTSPVPLPATWPAHARLAPGGLVRRARRLSRRRTKAGANRAIGRCSHGRQHGLASIVRSGELEARTNRADPRRGRWRRQL